MREDFAGLRIEGRDTTEEIEQLDASAARTDVQADELSGVQLPGADELRMLRHGREQVRACLPRVRQPHSLDRQQQRLGQVLAGQCPGTRLLRIGHLRGLASGVGLADGHQPGARVR